MEVEISEFENEIETLLNKEKQARITNDLNESTKILKQIAQTCFNVKQYTRFNELLIALCKKRGQPKKAQIEIVKMAMNEIKTLELEKKMEMINAVMKVCEKKIFLEVEYARCVLMITKYKEDDNQIADAAKILQEVQVETYGSMDKREKLEFILYQMKIMIKKQDYVRLFIISKKIEPKNIEDDNIADLKIVYYSYLVIYYRHENKYMECAEAYAKILETLHKNKSWEQVNLEFGFNASYNNVLVNYSFYLLISSYSQDRQEQLKKILETYKYQVEQLPFLKNLIDGFLGHELISTDPSKHQVQGIEIFGEQFEHFGERFKEFRRQLIQHNLRVFQTYYEAVSLQRIQELIEINTQEIEEEICQMKDKKLLTCKIDRTIGVVQFSLKKNENDVLQDWGDDINRVLNLIDLTSNLIKREEEIYL